MWLIVALSCTDKDVTQETGPPAVCKAGSAWTGQQAFVESSEAWGLADIAPVGVRVSAVDFDGDGWADLAVRGAMGVGSAESPQLWLLRNTQQGGFEDVSEASGVRALSSGGATWVFGDVDNDGDLDIYVGVDSQAVSGARSQLLLNSGDGRFELGSSGDLAFSSDRPYGAAFVDVDRDGNLDLFIGEYGSAQDYLYQGNGSGSFVEVTSERGLKTQRWSSASVLNAGEAHSNAWATLACDLNNDGSPELLTSSYGRAPNHLWLNDGAGSYQNRSVASGYAFDERVDWSDNESARCWCKLHPDDTDCAGVPSPAIACSSDTDAFRWNHDTDREPYRLGGNSGGTSCGDVNNDGWMDLLTSEIVHWDVGESSDPSEVLINLQDPQVAFERPGRESLGMTREHSSGWNEGDITGGMLDFDGDGWLDLYIGSSDYPGTRGLLYHNTGGSFEAVAPEVGIDHMRSHGSAVADFDHDGDLDMVVGHSLARCDDDCYETGQIRLFENLSQDTNSLSLRLVGAEGSNRAAIGARVEIKSELGTQTRVVDGGHGQWGQQDDLVVFAGLGPDCQASVTVTWPDAAGTVQVFELGAGYRYVLTQGEDAALEQ